MPEITLVPASSCFSPLNLLNYTIATNGMRTAPDIEAAFGATKWTRSGGFVVGCDAVQTLGRCHRFGETYCRHLHGWRSRRLLLEFNLAILCEFLHFETRKTSLFDGKIFIPSSAPGIAKKRRVKRSVPTLATL